MTWPNRRSVLLTKARARPHVLDGATIDRVERVHTAQMEFVGIYTRQIVRGRKEKPSPAQTRELDRMQEQNQRLHVVSADVPALASELRKGTIDRVLAMTDLEPGLQALLGTNPSDRRRTHPQNCVQYATIRFVWMGLPARHGRGAVMATAAKKYASRSAVRSAATASSMSW